MFWILTSPMVAQAQVELRSGSPEQVFVEAGGSQSWIILRGSKLEEIRELRSFIRGKVTDHVIGKPAPLRGGTREFVLMARPDATLGPVVLVAVLASGTVSVPVKAEIVAVGDPRARFSGKVQDLSEAARREASATIVAEADQVPQVESTIPYPLLVEPNGKVSILRLRGKNLEKVTDVRLRKEGAEARYRGKQGQLPFRQVPGGLEVEVVASRSTVLGSRFVIDLMVERYRAGSLALEVRVPPAPPVAPVVETREPAGPRVIELPLSPPAEP